MRACTGPGGRLLTLPALALQLARWLREQWIDVAVCAMPAAMDLAMAAGLRLAGVPYVVVVHDADLHPGERYAVQIHLQRWLVRGARAVFALSAHVAGRLREQGLPTGCTLMRSALPPFHYGPVLAAPPTHGDTLHLLSFGRLLPYTRAWPAGRCAGVGGAANRSRRPGRWQRAGERRPGPVTGAARRRGREPPVSESEIAPLLGWADAVILSHREASQSGITAAAIAARRWIVATRVAGSSSNSRARARPFCVSPSRQA